MPTDSETGLALHTCSHDSLKARLEPDSCEDTEENSFSDDIVFMDIIYY